MEHRYDILFSISVLHQDYPDSDGIYFTIKPTDECRRQLSRHNMIFKENNKGGLIIIEKTVEKNGEIIPTRPFIAPVDFTFFIDYVDDKLLLKTEPYYGGTFQSGVLGSSSFMCYFDNLNAGLQAGMATELAADGEASTEEDIYMIYPPKFSIPVTRAKKINALPLTPQGKPIEFKPKESSSQYIEVDLPSGAYEMTLEGGTPLPAERALVYSDLKQTKAMGLARIFKDSAVDYQQPIAYTITFRQVT